MLDLPDGGDDRAQNRLAGPAAFEVAVVQLQEAEQRRERRAELVAGHRQKLVLEPQQPAIRDVPEDHHTARMVQVVDWPRGRLEPPARAIRADHGEFGSKRLAARGTLEGPLA